MQRHNLLQLTSSVIFVILTFEPFTWPTLNMSSESNLSAVLMSVGDLQLVSQRLLSFNIDLSGYPELLYNPRSSSVKPFRRGVVRATNYVQTIEFSLFLCHFNYLLQEERSVPTPGKGRKFQQHIISLVSSPDPTPKGGKGLGTLALILGSASSAIM